MTTGTHSITAAYAGDLNFASSTSDELSLLVGQSASTTVVTSSANPSVFGQGVTFSATVAAGDGVGYPDRDGAVLRRWCPVGVAGGGGSSGVATSAAISNLSVDAHSIDAHYSGDVDFSVSQGNLIQTVGKGASTTTVDVRAELVVVRSVGDVDGDGHLVGCGGGCSVGQVEFFDGATSLGTGTLTAGVATLRLRVLSVGSHAITAVYAGDVNFTTSTSTAATQVVTTAGTSTAVSSSLNPSVFSNAVTFTATGVGGGAGDGDPGRYGRVLRRHHVVGCRRWRRRPVSGSLTVSTLAGGAHSITAKFVSADANVFGDSTSA